MITDIGSRETRPDSRYASNAARSPIHNLSEKAKDAKKVPRKRAVGSGVRVRRITILETQKVSQLIDGTTNAVITAAGKGTFLIRRSKEYLSSPNPHLCCEVRRIDESAGIVQRLSRLP